MSSRSGAAIFSGIALSFFLKSRLSRPSSPLLFDSDGADLRILRKAETVLSHRTSRIVLVIERCSSTHNYTAVLRTAEALGIQHVFLIQPPVENPDELVKNEAASTIDNGCGQELKYNEEGDLIEVIDKSSSRKSWKRRREVFVTDLEEKKKHAAYARNACK